MSSMYFTVDHSTPMTSVITSSNCLHSMGNNFSINSGETHHLQQHQQQHQPQYANLDVNFALPSNPQQQANYIDYSTTYDSALVNGQLTTTTNQFLHHHHHTNTEESANLISSEFQLENCLTSFNPLDEIEPANLFQPTTTSMNIHDYASGESMRLSILQANDITVCENKPTEGISRVDLLNNIIQRTQIQSSSVNSNSSVMANVMHNMHSTANHHIQSQYNFNSMSVLTSSMTGDYQVLDIASRRCGTGGRVTKRQSKAKGKLAKTDSFQVQIPSPYPLMCVVCGFIDQDPIHPKVGFHYGALSCEACKLFFRRTGMNGKTINECKTKDCEVVCDKRAQCPECRYKKCIAVGK